MDCNDCGRMLGAHLDEELDVVNDAAVAAHLENCPACAEAALLLAEQHRLFQEPASRFPAPPDLAAQIRAALPRPTPAESAGAGRWWPAGGWRFATLSAGLAVAILGGFFIGVRHERADALASELTEIHVRARLTGHLFDVESTDRHTVKPWFIGKVDFAPFVPDLAADGFPLIGGRLERLVGHTVATMVYRRRLHSIDLHVWSGGPASLSGSLSRDGYSLSGWQSGGLNFAAVSDLAPEEFATFCKLVKQAQP